MSLGGWVEFTYNNMLEQVTTYNFAELLTMKDLDEVRDIIGDYVEDLCGYRVSIADRVHAVMYEKVVTYHPSGAKWQEYRTKFGVRDGLYQAWYDNGVLMTQYTLVNGVLHGNYKCWFSNGVMQMDCWYAHGKLHGSYKTWYETGQICEKGGSDTERITASMRSTVLLVFSFVSPATRTGCAMEPIRCGP